MKIKSKALLAALCAVLLVGATMFGTLAWLADTTDTVVNTFTVGDIDISLEETPNTDTDDDDENDTWTAQLIPSKVYAKDPVVTVEDTTLVDCYLFVKFEEPEDVEDCLDYTSNLTSTNGWTLVEGTTDVWYREVKTTDTTKEWHLLKDDIVTVKSTLTKEDMPDAAFNLTYTAYAIQTEGFTTANLAWAEITNSLS